jgi:hypothetical protein
MLALIRVFGWTSFEVGEITSAGRDLWYTSGIFFENFLLVMALEEVHG